MKRIGIIMLLVVLGCGLGACKKTTKDTKTKKETKKKASIDHDLTKMGSEMVYSTVYQMINEPAEYEGQKIRMEGNFSKYYDKKTKKTYYSCVIQDATECCAQGMEFTGDEATIKALKNKQEIQVTGTFNTYKEGDTTYCRLKDVTIKKLS